MQTFLPHADYVTSAKRLDSKRLGKQRVEGLMILRALFYGTGWRHHPAVRMWEGHTNSLVVYLEEIVTEWLQRGYKDNCLPEIQDFWNPSLTFEPPWWLGDERLHSSHRANLLRKDANWYGRFGWTEKPATEYWWPVKGSIEPTSEDRDDAERTQDGVPHRHGQNGFIFRNEVNGLGNGRLSTSACRTSVGEALHRSRKVETAEDRSLWGRYSGMTIVAVYRDPLPEGKIETETYGPFPSIDEARSWADEQTLKGKDGIWLFRPLMKPQAA